MAGETGTETHDRRVKLGVLLNMGAGLGTGPGEVFDFTVEQATAAEQLGYDELWVTEHHFIRFGINPSAVTTAAFLLGRTSRISVGTAVALSPLYHPVDLAERTALLDQLSHGRFVLGLGRGGYRRDFDVLDIDYARWDGEPMTGAQRILDLWASTDSVEIQPPARTRPHPELLLATSSPAGVDFAARNGLALQHYFAVPAEQRVRLEARYAELLGDGRPAPDHLHTLIVVVDDGPDVRERLEASLRTSFRDGDHPHVPQAGDRHIGPDGKPVDRDAMATSVANLAIVGGPNQVADELGRFMETTGATRIAVYHEAIGDPATTMKSLQDFAILVAPQIGAAAPIESSGSRTVRR
ncbi:LLM class flavin-dependent oxidoreductase [Mycolicibacterium sp. HK-90]|uniref:LLM class flavin-dependent oxidoreductase n=1 Tax=Mycolicibacterium sp. HK-90 TaxID=3056937 RepID=UPI00265A2332|nr:LLM class flavin-dependent oxidoreductase [Mycolicibacterium sp. HK-90]WKG01975.1 LLM class flavin-dependent oxidoreductase [Mycolicibacterium sp. HK-90]